MNDNQDFIDDYETVINTFIILIDDVVTKDLKITIRDFMDQFEEEYKLKKEEAENILSDECQNNMISQEIEYERMRL